MFSTEPTIRYSEILKFWGLEHFLHDNFLLRLFKVFPEKQYFLHSCEDII